MGNGIPNDDYVNTANINTVNYLYVSYQNIADLTGIEAFTALTYLSCGYNQLTSLNVSQNTALTYLECWYNQLTSLRCKSKYCFNLFGL
jgi:trimeric autotransporter adhesin